ncbi:MAG TPA: hypothetical protein VHN39_13140 [Phenylobacterium sp.]|nr:hypothetical protein [Phenylobacterium sp.]
MNVDSARDDLAFMRALVEPGDAWQKQFGEAYSAAGLCYCVQMLLHGGQFFGLVPPSGPIALTVGLGPTVVFLLLLIWIIRRNPRPAGGSATSRAVNSVFGAVGFTNMALILTIGSIAWRWHSINTWLIYPCVVMILQGLAWLVAYMLRRRPWLAGVAAGWFATGVAMAYFIDNPAGFVISAGVGMFAFMLAPGLFLLRQGRTADA